jgi:hypothetical protein
MKLSVAEIKGYQAQINRKLTEREIPHLNTIEAIILSQEEIDMLPDYEKQLYKEALLMRRHLDIQQKIHKKSRVRDQKERTKEDHDIVNGQMIDQLNQKLREYKLVHG